MLSDPEVKRVLALAVDPAKVEPDGNYTRPRTWGVYEIEPPSSNRSTRRYRIGNHPIRQRELEQEFGKTTMIAVFTSRTHAEELERLLNGRS